MNSFFKSVFYCIKYLSKLEVSKKNRSCFRKRPVIHEELLIAHSSFFIAL